MNRQHSEILVSLSDTTQSTATIRHLRARIKPSKIGLFIISILLFILAITLMQKGAQALIPILQHNFDLSKVSTSLGLGWLSAYVIMSGSPIAAAALTFLDAAALDEINAFAMITGSRFGAGFIVLFVGFIYLFRGHGRATGLGIGLLSLIVTGVTQAVGLFIGIGLIRIGLFRGMKVYSGNLLIAWLDRLLDPVINLFLQFLPVWSLFLLGLGLIMVSFNLFDRCLPQTAIKESQVGRVSRLVYRPWVMFGLGAVVTLLSMSVSISLSLLVPLSNRGFIRRENVIPYIMGANVTTFIDTLLAAILIGNPAGLHIVLIQMFSNIIVSIVILALMYHPFERAMLLTITWITRETHHLVMAMIAIIVIPIILILL